jgi:hypothetical protein
MHGTTGSQAVFLAGSGFRQSGVISSHPKRVRQPLVRTILENEGKDVRVRLIEEGQTQHVLAHIAEIGEIREVHGVWDCPDTE